jgi:tetraacyldisaccharide 4'-kinase
MAALVATALRDAGERPSILSRGYARRRVEDGVVVVRDADGIRADLDRSGDEPLMLAKQLDGVAVLVASSRHLAGRLAECRLGCTVHVLDDGFQHFDLERDVDLVVVTPEDLDRPITLPAGRLREPIDAMSAADAIVLLDSPEMDRSVDAGVLRSHGPVWRAHRRQPRATTDDPVFAVAGIASPERFFAGLRAAGWRVAGELAFRDHHSYTRADLAHVADAVRRAGARRVVTTEKDLVRLLPFRPFPVAIDAVPLSIALDDQPAFVDWLLSKVRGARTGETVEATLSGQR